MLEIHVGLNGKARNRIFQIENSITTSLPVADPGQRLSRLI